jgi:hypothetical protein
MPSLYDLHMAIHAEALKQGPVGSFAYQSRYNSVGQRLRNMAIENSRTGRR